MFISEAKQRKNLTHKFGFQSSAAWKRNEPVKRQAAFRQYRSNNHNYLLFLTDFKWQQ